MFLMFFQPCHSRPPPQLWALAAALTLPDSGKHRQCGPLPQNLSQM
jgi:hypothetical protein